MTSLRHRMRHAFAVDEKGAAVPTPEQQPAVDWLCRQVVKRHLTTPGLIALEMARPLNMLASSMMRVAEPVVWAIARQATRDHYQHLATYLEQRGAAEYLCQRIEELEASAEATERQRRDESTSSGSGKES